MSSSVSTSTLSTSTIVDSSGLEASAARKQTKSCRPTIQRPPFDGLQIKIILDPPHESLGERLFAFRNLIDVRTRTRIVACMKVAVRPVNIEYDDIRRQQVVQTAQDACRTLPDRNESSYA